MDTAERLLGEQGYDATSLRQIIAEAGVNLAAIHYHFGSKEELLDELVQRRAGPVNEQRLALLDRSEAEAGTAAVPVEQILEAFMMPMVDVASKTPQFVRLMGRIYAEGLMPAIVRKHFQAVVARFLDALRRALPELPEKELLWRIHFMIGAMAHTMCGPPDPILLGDTGDFHSRIDSLVAFVSGGLRAPLPASVRQSKNSEVTQ